MVYTVLRYASMALLKIVTDADDGMIMYYQTIVN